MDIVFEEVTRKKSKSRIAMMGTSGAGKTLSALYLAYGITGNWKKIALIDTEHERGRFYANRSDLNTGTFLYAPMTAPYSPEKYIQYVKSAEKAVGSDGVIIIDSFSHCWNNEGGVLEIKEEIKSRNTGRNDFSIWNDVGKIQNNLINTILSVNCHTIVTLRTKMGYAMEVNEKGKTVPVKIGLEPVQRDNAEYEFDIVFQIDRQNHIASLSKDTTFLDKWSGVITPELGTQLNEWLSEGKEAIKCSECGNTITSRKTKDGNIKTAEQIADGTKQKYGEPLCMSCLSKRLKAEREREKNAASTVSE